MDAETIEDLVANRKTAAKEIDDGEGELEELLREAGLDGDEDIEVINPKTGSKEYISKDDSSCYDSSSFKGRRYKGSSQPKDMPTFLWQRASKAARERAKREALLKDAAEKHDAAAAKERKYDRVINRLAATAEPKPTTTISDDFFPATAIERNYGIIPISCAFTF